jgi:N6-L-threonylcarbamoyladenine synthase
MLELKWTKMGPGAALEEFCAQSLDVSLPDIPHFPRPMKGKLGFSYASLHSHVERYIQSRGGIDKLDLPTKLALGRAFQTAAVIHLVDKFRLALDWCFENKVTVQDLVVSGGVASNAYLQER